MRHRDVVVSSLYVSEWNERSGLRRLRSLQATAARLLVSLSIYSKVPNEFFAMTCKDSAIYKTHFRPASKNQLT